MLRTDLKAREYVEGVDPETMHLELDQVIGPVSATRIHRANIARGLALSVGLGVAFAAYGQYSEASDREEYDVELEAAAEGLANDRANAQAGLEEAKAEVAEAEEDFVDYPLCLETTREFATEQAAGGFSDPNRLALEMAVENEETGICGTQTSVLGLWDAVFDLSTAEDIFQDQSQQVELLAGLTPEDRVDPEVADGVGNEQIWLTAAYGALIGLYSASFRTKTPYGVRHKRLTHYLKSQLEPKIPYDRWRGLDNPKVRSDVDKILRRYDRMHQAG